MEFKATKLTGIEGEFDSKKIANLEAGSSLNLEPTYIRQCF